MQKKTIGIISGAGPLAGAELLKRILILAQKNYGCFKDADFPKILLLSFPFSEMLGEELNFSQIKQELKSCFASLEKGGATLFGIACNTLHVFLEEKVEGLLSLPEIIAEVIERTPLILSTSTSRKFNLHGKKFPCEYLTPKDQQMLDEIIESILQGASESILFKLGEILKNYPQETVVLGCTELSLIEKEFFPIEKQIIDPMDLLVSKLVEHAFSGRETKIKGNGEEK